jgi:ribosomal protein L40E
MPSNRPNLTRPRLTLDEGTFQGLLSAAFTIQEHNERQKQARQAQAGAEARPVAKSQATCPHCGALKLADASRCEDCGQDELRPGERLQRNWASMWLMSQEQGLWPDRSPEIENEVAKEFGNVTPVAGEVTRKQIQPPTVRWPRMQAAIDSTGSDSPALPVPREAKTKSIAPEKSLASSDRAHNKSLLEDFLSNAALDIQVSDRTVESHRADRVVKPHALDDEASQNFPGEEFPSSGLLPEDMDLTVEPFRLRAADSYPTEATEVSSTISSTDANLIVADPIEITASGAGEAPTSFRQRLADFRVILHFHRADLYLGLAVFVAVFALLWPATTSPQKSAFGPWERVLIAMGIAEAPTPAVHLQGDPAIQVWVDPHTALYYCAGEESYGKTANGHLSTQRDAQMDQFEPANRSACE